jgi:PAS domain S-box-containing protein
MHLLWRMPLFCSKVRALRLHCFLSAVGTTIVVASAISAWALAGLWVLVALLSAAILHESRRRATAEQAAKESIRRYDRLAEHSFDMIVTFDPRTQQRTYVSPACRRLYGYEPEEAVALSARDVIHPDDFQEVQAAVDRAEHGDQSLVVYRGCRKDGSYIWVEASLTPLSNPTTGNIEIISVVRDASERVRSQTELRAAKEQADTASVAKSEFLAIVSHELRTPLNAIIGFADLMRQEVMGPIENTNYLEYICDIHHSGIHLLDLINDILDFSKAEAGKLELNEDIIDASETVGGVIRLLSQRIAAAGLVSRIDIAPDLPLLRADESKLRQVILNLISNAIKFTPRGGHIEARVLIDPAGLAITIADSGIGISPEYLERIFHPFVQIDSAYNRQHQGTGLGLALVKAMVELHEGTVTLKSVVDVGTEVTALFPAQRIVRRASVPCAA